MAEKKKQTLGKGLDQIFGGNVQQVIDNIKETRTSGRTIEVPISKLIPNPFQPRKYFSDDDLKGLSDSIKQNGLFTPILIKEGDNGNYYIVAGERRARAANLSGLKNINAVIANITEEEMQRIALVENIQRADLNPIEVAKSLKDMIERQNLKIEEASKIIGKSRPYVSNLLGLLKLDDKIVASVLNGEISYGHARSLITLSKEDSENIFNQIIEKKLSVRETEGYAKAAKLREARATKKPLKINKKAQEIIYAEELVKGKLKSKVEITSNEIKIKYNGREQLSKILERMEAIEK